MAPFLRILILCVALISLLPGCSRGILRYIEIPSQSSVALSDMFDRVSAEVSAAGFPIAGAVCDEKGFLIARYRAKSANLRIALVSNGRANVLALEFLELGVSAFSPGAEEDYRSLLRSLQARSHTVREHAGDQDVPAFLKRLSSDQMLSSLCARA
jgi:hypothetical protein